MGNHFLFLHVKPLFYSLEESKTCFTKNEKTKRKNNTTEDYTTNVVLDIMFIKENVIYTHLTLYLLYIIKYSHKLQGTFSSYKIENFENYKKLYTVTSHLNRSTCSTGFHFLQPTV